jgi:hypothetical protein
VLALFGCVSVNGVDSPPRNKKIRPENGSPANAICT